MEPRPERPTLESQLRATAPTLPPHLRQQVLLRCQAARPRHYSAFVWCRQWRLAGALTSLVLCCWVVSGRLDAQSQALIEGGNKQPSGSVLAARPDIVSLREADSQSFGAALRWRLRQLALLLHEKQGG